MSLIIGVLGRPKEDNTFSFKKIICDIIVKNRAIPLGVLPPVIDVNNELNCSELNYLNEIINMCDGIILQGGSDLYPYDIAAVKYINSKDIPVLGICLGMQTLGIASGASFDKAINHNQPDVDYVHEANIVPNSKLHDILQKDKIMINSRHNDMIINPSYNVVGYIDNTIEAIEDSSKMFNIGVQWHPEDLNDINSYNLFKVFFTSCEEYHQKKRGI